MGTNVCLHLCGTRGRGPAALPSAGLGTPPPAQGPAASDSDPREQRWVVGTSGLRWEVSAQSSKHVPSLTSERRGQRDLSSFPVCT